MSDFSRERTARHQAARRAVNDAIMRGRRPGQSTHAFLCECGVLGCTELIELEFSEYEAVRRHRRRFFVFGGHEAPDIDTVVERRPPVLVVEAGAELQHSLDMATTPSGGDR
jgi:hypothetical protein